MEDLNPVRTDHDMHSERENWSQEDSRWRHDAKEWEKEWQDSVRKLNQAVGHLSNHTHAISLFKRMIDTDQQSITVEELAMMARRWFIGGDASENEDEQEHFEVTQGVHHLIDQVHNGLAVRHARLIEATNHLVYEIEEVLKP